MTQLAADRVEDGRVARRLENRVRILDALFALIRGGRSHPTLREIAAKAGVTSRTLLNHFPDLGSLLLAAAVRARELAVAGLPALSQHPDPEQRVRSFFQSAIGFFESYSAIRWSVLTFPGEMPSFEQRPSKGVVRGMVANRVIELVEGFGVSLERDKHLRQAVLVFTDPIAWRLLRVQQRASRVEAAEIMARGVIALAREARHAQRSRA